MPASKPTAAAPQSSFHKIVPCPCCGGDSVYSETNPYRPFCSQRCRQMDLGAWANEEFRMPTELPPEDAEFGDPRKLND